MNCAPSSHTALNIFKKGGSYEGMPNKIVNLAKQMELVADDASV
jgi:hypothetical protein